MRDDVAAEIWQRQRAWAEASGRFQSETKFYRRIQLLLIVAGSALATAAATDLLGLNDASTETMASGNRIIAGFGAAALAMVGIVQQHFLSLKRSERWPRCRSVAESLKSEVFKFRAGAKPYNTSPDADADSTLRLLTDTVTKHERKAGDLVPHIRPSVVTGAGAPTALDPEGYILARLDDQIDKFYLPSAQKNLRYANIARKAMIVLSVFGVLISCLMSAGGLLGVGVWVSVLTTISAATATFASLNRFEFLASAYAKQAYALSQLRREWRTGHWQDWSDFVAKCEETISAENRAWMAEMLEERETLAGALPEKQQGSAS